MMQPQATILGGGLVGLAASRVFSRLGWRVRLVEERPMMMANAAALDARGIALSLSSIRILQTLGLDPVDIKGGADIREIHVSSAGHFGLSRLSADQLGVDSLGRVVEYARLSRSLVELVSGDSAIEILAGAKFQRLEQDAQSVALKLDVDGESCRFNSSSLLVVADGGRSPIGEQLGIRVSQYEYGQAAIAATIEVEQPRPGRAYERFTREGPLAMLPLEDNHYALIWTAGPARIGHLLQASDHAFIQELQRVFGYRLGYLRAVGRRDRFDLRLRRASTLVSGRCVLVGNAANTLHPVAGQGFNLALRDLGGLSDLVEAQDTDNLMNVLQRYPQLRQPDHDRTVALGHGLVQVFSTDNILQGHAAAAGLSLFELCPLAKHAFGWQAMGFTGGVNSLMRGVG